MRDLKNAIHRALNSYKCKYQNYNNPMTIQDLLTPLKPVFHESADISKSGEISIEVTRLHNEGLEEMDLLVKHIADTILSEQGGECES